MELWDYDKFWVIWCSCIDKPRTIKEIQRIWKYKGNALYQKGMREPIAKEMIDSGFLVYRGVVKERGVTGTLFYAKLDWLPKFLEKFFNDLKIKFSNSLPSQLYECIKDKQKFVEFLDKKRTVFFLPDKLKVLFGNSENIRTNYEMVIIAPMLFLFNLLVLRVLQEQLKLKREMSFIVTQSMVFNPSLRINFLGYSMLLMKDFKIESIPLGLIDEKKLFKLWLTSARKIYSDL